MLTINRIVGVGTTFLLALTVIITVFGSVAAQKTTGTMEYCEVTLTGCPQDYDTLEIVVPLGVIAMSAQIRACGIYDETSTEGSNGVPAVIFVIDNSKSMGNINVDGRDPNGNRFKATLALIDSIYAVYPSAEVGIVIFNDALIFNADRDANLKRFNGTTYPGLFLDYLNQSYLPLKPLNSLSTRGMTANGGADHIFTRGEIPWKDLLNRVFSDTAVVTGGIPRVITQVVEPTIGGRQAEDTDISLAFEAAVEAFKATNLPRENQCIIFLSDGDALLPYGSGGNRNPRIDNQNNYFENVNDVPTTYTIYLGDARNKDIPANLDTMTNRIRRNGYSDSNDDSRIWIQESNYNELLTRMMENIISPMLSKSEGNANSIVISSAGISDSAKADNEEHFIFNRQLPIDTAEVTTISMGVRYYVRVDSTYTLDLGMETQRDTTYTVHINPDSLFTYEFKLRRSADPPAGWDTLMQTSRCYERPTLSLLFQGAGLPGLEANGTMDTLTVLFDNTGGMFDYDSVWVDVNNSRDASFYDFERLTLRREAGSIWTMDFQIEPFDHASAGDGILQLGVEDSIIVVFRNPHIPLDTLRVAVPYITSNVAFYSRDGEPKPEWRLPTTVEMTAGSYLDIYAKFFDQDHVYDPSFESDPSKLEWTWKDPDSNATIETDGIHCRFYSETANAVYSMTLRYLDDRAIPLSHTIHVRVVPAPQRYLEVVLNPYTYTAMAKVRDTNVLKRAKEFPFSKDIQHITFYVIERDRFGNYIGLCAGAEWTSANTMFLSAEPQGDSSSALITRLGTTSADNLLITVEKDGISTMVFVRLAGETSMALTPNPFIPGRSDVEKTLRTIDPSGMTYLFYRDIIVANRNKSGILIATTAPTSIMRNTNGTPTAKVMIYDATGKVVFRSAPRDITLASDNTTFGLIWDGRNNNRRRVAGGNYFVTISGTMENGIKYNAKRLIGIKVE
ncbi:MAG: hypothetical protein FWC23_02715 [Chitinispirillia bacterium]|nr:hypothetical protein [Chitinispirillia bacterium]MCL2268089.1 hypothetical protein [Chitinispirillia bacterium]